MQDSAIAPRVAGSLADREQFVSEWRAGWRTLASAGIGTGLGHGLLIMTAGLFIIPMQEEFHWSRSALAIGPVALLVSSVLQPVAGAIIDRFGARRVAIAGLLMLCAAYAMLSATRPDPWVFYSVVAFVAVAGPVSSGLPLVKGVATWFSRNAGLAFGITLSGPSLVSAVALPVLAWIIQQFGWRTGYLTLGALVAFVGLPLVIAWFRERPATVQAAAIGETAKGDDRAAAALPGVFVREALQDGRYWRLVIALGGAAIPIGGFVSQLQPLLVSLEFTPTVAASVGTVFVLAIGSSRILAGRLLDRFNPSVVAAGCLALPALGAMLLVTAVHGEASWWVAAAAVVLLGVGNGAEVDFIAFFTLRLFGVRRFSVIFGTMVMAVNAGLAAGGLLFARIFDIFASYRIALYASLVIYLIAALVMSTVRVPEQDRSSHRQAH